MFSVVVACVLVGFGCVFLGFVGVLVGFACAFVGFVGVCVCVGVVCL